jgi:hypothetical protein
MTGDRMSDQPDPDFWTEDVHASQDYESPSTAVDAVLARTRPTNSMLWEDRNKLIAAILDKIWAHGFKIVRDRFRPELWETMISGVDRTRPRGGPVKILPQNAQQQAVMDEYYDWFYGGAKVPADTYKADIALLSWLHAELVDKVMRR